MSWFLRVAVCGVLCLAAPASSAITQLGRPVLDRFELVGHSALGAGVDSADLWAHGSYAYVGSSCGAQRRGGGGVRVVDISRPARPLLVGSLRNDVFTRAEDVVVRRVRTASFDGDLAAVGIQACVGSGHEREVATGLRFFDVTEPRRPRLLSSWLLPPGAFGCHEIDLAQRRGGRVLAGCARQLHDQIAPSGAQIPGGVQIVDATDPGNPATLASWQLPLAATGGVGCLPMKFAHSIRFANDGNDAYVSYWDAGTVHLDLTDPVSPVVRSVTATVPPDEDGDNHSLTRANGGRWLVINQEDFSPAACAGEGLGGWGEVFVYDNADSTPTLLGRFGTRNARSTRSDGNYTAHNTEVGVGRQFFSSWYSDGVVWWTMSDRGAARQLGHFVPPAAPAFRVPLVWGVFVDHVHDVILASDIGTGLWIVRPKGLKQV